MSYYQYNDFTATAGHYYASPWEQYQRPQPESVDFVNPQLQYTNTQYPHQYQQQQRFYPNELHQGQQYINANANAGGFEYPSPSPEPLVPSPEPLVPSPEPLVPGPEPLVPGPEPLVPGPQPLVPGPQIPGSPVQHDDALVQPHEVEQQEQQVLPDTVLPDEVQNPEAALEAFTAPLRPNNKKNKVQKARGAKAKEPSKRPVGKDSCDHCRRNKTRCIREENEIGCNHCQKKGLTCTTNGRDKRTNKTTKAEYQKAYDECYKYQSELHVLAEHLRDQVGAEPEKNAALSLATPQAIDVRFIMCLGRKRPNLVEEVNRVCLPGWRNGRILSPDVTQDLKLNEMREWFGLLQQHFRSEVHMLAIILMALTHENYHVRKRGAEVFKKYDNNHRDLVTWVNRLFEEEVNDNYGVVNFHTKQIEETITKHRS